MAAGKIVAALPGAWRAIGLREIFLGESLPWGEIAEEQGVVVWH
jgi:hypothetical protein